MTPDVKKTWCEALRGNEFVQAKQVLAGQSVIIAGSLHQKPRCCIGVAYDVLNWAHTNNCHDSVDLEDHADDPTETACRALQLDQYVQAHLVLMNDGGPNDEHGKTFAEIADWIEANV